MAERAAVPDGPPFGEIVPFQDPPDTTRIWVPETVHPSPERVAILTEGGLNETGIVPYVPFDLDAGDPVHAIIEHYAE